MTPIAAFHVFKAESLQAGGLLFFHHDSPQRSAVFNFPIKQQNIEKSLNHKIKGQFK
jgi:hypothetical protein